MNSNLIYHNKEQCRCQCWRRANKEIILWVHWTIWTDGDEIEVSSKKQKRKSSIKRNFKGVNRVTKSESSFTTNYSSNHRMKNNKNKIKQKRSPVSFALITFIELVLQCSSSSSPSPSLRLSQVVRYRYSIDRKQIRSLQIDWECAKSIPFFTNKSHYRWWPILHVFDSRSLQMDQSSRAFSFSSFDPIVHWARLLCDDKYAHDDVSNEYKHTYTNIQSLWINTRRRRLLSLLNRSLLMIDFESRRTIESMKSFVIDIFLFVFFSRYVYMSLNWRTNVNWHLFTHASSEEKWRE